MTETRSSLVARVRDPADAASWGEFKELYEPLLTSYVRSHGLSEHDAGDVVQDIFLSLVRKLPAFELDHRRGKFRTWLWQVTCHAIADWARKQRRRSAAEEEWRSRLAALDRNPNAESDAAWRTAHRQQVLDYVLQKVRGESQPKTWACFERHLLKGERGAAVAADLEITVDAVYVNASRVLARVRQRCADYLEELSDV